MKKGEKKEVKKEIKREVSKDVQKMSEKKKKSPPNRQSDVRHTMEVVRKIKLGEGVQGAATFTTADISINAGNAALYPRLSQIAKTYQYWRFTKWSVSYEPIASVFGNAQSGQVCFSLLENWYDAAPDSMTAQTERSRAVRNTSAWLPATLTLPATRWLNVRDAPGSQGQDMRLDDVIIEVGTEGFAAAAVGQVVGFLFLTAEVEFRTPYTVSLQSPPRTNKVQAFLNHTDTAYLSSPAGVSADILWDFGSSSVSLLDNSFYTGVTYNGGATFLLQGGTYVLSLQGNCNCAGAGAIYLKWVCPDAVQLFQTEYDPTYGTRYDFLAVASLHVETSCVVNVAEGKEAVIHLRGYFSQAASAPVTIQSLLLTVNPF